MGWTEAAACVEASERVGTRDTSDLLQIEYMCCFLLNTLSQGLKLTDLFGKISTYSGDIPSLNPFSLIETHLFISRIESMATKVPTDAPWNATQALEWDSMTVESFKRVLYTATASALLDAACAPIFGALPRDMSLLYFLFYAASGGGLEHLLKTEGGAQQDRIVGGTQQISQKLVDAIEKNGGVVKTSHPVASIVQNDGLTSVRTHNDNNQVFNCKYVVIAVPLPLQSTIRFSPPLSVDRVHLAQRCPMGHIIKIIITYTTAFWRTRGFSGEVISDTGPAGYVVDDSSHDYDASGGKEGQAALLCFIMADKAAQWGDTHDHSNSKSIARKEAVLKQLARYFGDAALSPEDYVEKDWALDEFATGSPVAICSPGALTNYGKAMRSACGAIHFAGTETAIQNCGFMDGAINSGQRAAKEILERLSRSLSEQQ
eukprot:TRINITY_DN1584_c0_g1_i1.p1 TRINITY_DN1584_c0_g1~~TRINITY_DN1584_c0_g1_i1.p1  ORF type:complete len:431 (-),score=86.66 TRINITY_DN1584_c0_g1_i1:81-1373(-)